MLLKYTLGSVKIFLYSLGNFIFSINLATNDKYKNYIQDLEYTNLRTINLGSKR